MSTQEQARIHVGNAPCSWGRLEFDAGLEQDDKGQDPGRPADDDGQIPFDRMLDELTATGYSGTELGDWAYMPTDAESLRSELQQRRLTMLGAFVPVAFADERAHEDGERHALRVARLLSAVADVGDPRHRPFVVLADDNGRDPVRTRHAGRVTPDMMLDEEAWQTFGRGVDRVAQAVHIHTGLPTVFHHHCAGFVETPPEIEQLLSRTDPDLVGLVFDTGHYAFGAGGDLTADGDPTTGGCGQVIDGLRRFADRIRYVHFKDCSAEVAQHSRAEGWDYFTALAHGIFCELGNGCVDFPAVLNELRAMNYAGWVVVEQDVLPGMGAPKESAARNRQYLAGIGL